MRELIETPYGRKSPRFLCQAMDAHRLLMQMMPLLEESGVLNLYIADTPECRKIFGPTALKLGACLERAVELEQAYQELLQTPTEKDQ